MRIISGSLKGRRLNPPLKKMPARPTTDRAREALFNWLNNRIDFEDLRILDLFGGTGAVTLEFISRGCKEVYYLDRHYHSLQYLKKIAAEWEIDSNLTLIKADAYQYIKNCSLKFSLIFMDPPYDFRKYNELLTLILERKLVLPGGYIILEHDKRQSFSEIEGHMESRKYGDSHFTFIQV